MIISRSAVYRGYYVWQEPVFCHYRESLYVSVLTHNIYTSIDICIYFIYRVYDARRITTIHHHQWWLRYWHIGVSCVLVI